MKCVCPGCNTRNLVPNVWAGSSFACRKCETQVNAPDLPDKRPRSWLASPGWAAVALAELLSVAGLAALLLALAWGSPPADLPLVKGMDGASPQIAVPGEPLPLEWRTGLRSVGGHFLIARQQVELVDADGTSRTLGVRAVQKPWADLHLEPDTAPSPEPIVLSLEVDMPEDETLAGQRATVRASVRLEYPVQRSPDAPIRVHQAVEDHEEQLVVSDEAQRARFRAYRRARTWMRVGVGACALLGIAVAIGAFALARKEITVVCPRCGRATDAIFYHERGPLYISACPHKRSRRHPQVKGGVDDSD